MKKSRPASDAQILYDGLGYLYKVETNIEIIETSEGQDELKVHIRLPNGTYISVKNLVRVYLGGTERLLADYPGLKKGDKEL